jgi:anti-sigma regulatory factor (Ser/Thr protein kinase)
MIMSTKSADFPATPSSVAAARRLVRDAVMAFGLRDLDDRAELLASELVTNAVRHARGPVRVRASHRSTRTITVTVCDEASALPKLEHRERSDDRGRGLQIVDTISDRWGVETRENGKCVWFELVSANSDPEGGPDRPGSTTPGSTTG